MGSERVAWHFTGDTLRDGSPIPAVGETLIYKGRIELCASGYHWSLKPHQALRYAPGNRLHMVQYGGEVFMGDDKGVSSQRTILATVAAEPLLRRFAADQALSMAHLWEMPEAMREYLTTLDDSKKTTARWAAWAAFESARAAAVDAAAWLTAWTAAWADAMTEFDRRVYAAFGVSENGNA